MSFPGCLGSIRGGNLSDIGSVEFDSDACLVVVLAAPGYPGEPTTGALMHGLDRSAELPGITLFHSGTRRDGDQWRTAGGRVLGVTARGEDVEQARSRAYEAVNLIQFEGMHFRRDIGIARRGERGALKT